MPVRAALLITTAALTLWATGCAGASRLSLARHTGGSAALYSQFQVYDGHTTRPISFSHLLRRCRAADVILFGEQHVRHVIDQYVEHYNQERPHKGLDYKRPMECEESPPCREGPILCRDRLGGLLKTYYRGAA